MGRVVLVGQWAAWEAEVVTGEVVLHQEDHEDQEETLLGEEMSNTEQETGSAPTRKPCTYFLPNVCVHMVV